MSQSKRARTIEELAGIRMLPRSTLLHVLQVAKTAVEEDEDRSCNVDLSFCALFRNASIKLGTTCVIVFDNSIEQLSLARLPLAQQPAEQRVTIAQSGSPLLSTCCNEFSCKTVA